MEYDNIIRRTCFDNIKTVVTNVTEGIKTVIDSIRTTFQNVFNSVKNTVSGAFNSIKSTISNVWNGIKVLLKLAYCADGNYQYCRYQYTDTETRHTMVRKRRYYDTSYNVRYERRFPMVGGESGAEAILPLDRFWNTLQNYMKPVSANEKPSIINQINVTVYSNGEDDDTLANKVAKELLKCWRCEFGYIFKRK